MRRRACTGRKSFLLRRRERLKPVQAYRQLSLETPLLGIK